jgi:hypothetical protein
VQATQAELPEAQHVLDPAVGWLGDPLPAPIRVLGFVGLGRCSRLSVTACSITGNCDASLAEFVSSAATMM